MVVAAGGREKNGDGRRQVSSELQLPGTVSVRGGAQSVDSPRSNGARVLVHARLCWEGAGVLGQAARRKPGYLF